MVEYNVLETQTVGVSDATCSSAAMIANAETKIMRRQDAVMVLNVSMTLTAGTITALAIYVKACLILLTVICQTSLAA